jgi:EAL domain-containing protein (putative c-di-GMP-specific phosphodiesterase class I)
MRPHPTHGLISPAEFIPIAEDNGRICDIGSWACHAAQGWPAGVSISVNVWPWQFELRDIVQTVVDALRLSGLAPDRTSRPRSSGESWTSPLILISAKLHISAN